MDHANVLPLVGFVMENGVPGLVSEWMENGTVSSFLKSNPNVDRFVMVSDYAVVYFFEPSQSTYLDVATRM